MTPVYSPAIGVWTTPDGHTATFEYRQDTSDWNTISSVMAPHDEYRVPSGVSGWALDIGAHLGAVTIALLLDNPELRVIAVEPVPDNARLARRNLELNGLTERCVVIEGAVGGPGDESVTVYYGYSGNETAEHHAFIGNSSLAYDNGGMLPHEERIYPAHTLSDLLRLTEYTRITWAKIDCEGGEWSFLQDPAVDLVDTWVGEWHPVRGKVRADIEPLLGKTHHLTFSIPDGVDYEIGPGEFRGIRR
jgi:FkbM family methyltransferase